MNDKLQCDVCGAPLATVNGEVLGTCEEKPVSGLQTCVRHSSWAALGARIDELQAERNELAKEVERLRGELETHERIEAMRGKPAPDVTTGTSSGGEDSDVHSGLIVGSGKRWWRCQGDEGGFYLRSDAAIELWLCPPFRADDAVAWPEHPAEPVPDTVELCRFAVDKKDESGGLVCDNIETVNVAQWVEEYQPEWREWYRRREGADNG